MLEVLEPIAAACRITVPPEHRRAIAVVGAGAIVDVAHLPAYRRAGLDVVGVHDLDPAAARRLADRHGVGRVYGSLDELLADDTVEVVDLAVPPQAQAELVERAVAAGKHLLCQKPLALDRHTAAGLVEIGERGDVRIAVNQQLRFDEGIAAAKAMIDAGWIGAVTSIRWIVDIHTDWSAWPWLLSSPELEFRFHSIHYVDAIRHLVGTPDAVFATAGRLPGQAATGETRTTSQLLYPGDLQVAVLVNHENPTDEPVATVRIDGVDGSIEATLGLLAGYPDGGPDTLRVWSDAVPTDGWLAYPVTTRWIPDAFAGPMAGLLAWIADGAPAPTAARDNLATVTVVDALYESAASRTVVPIDVPDVPDAQAADG